MATLLPRDMNLTQSRVIAFAQESKTMKVLGAKQTESLETMAPNEK